MVLDSGDTRHLQESLILFISLIGTPMLPDPASTLARILAHLDARRVSIYVMRCQELCALTALFYFICLTQAPVHKLDCTHDLSPAHLSILVTAVLVGIALGDAALLDFMDMDKQMAAAESLVAHARCVLKVDSPTVSARPMFDLVSPDLRAFICDMIRETLTVSDNDEDGYYQEPEYVKWLTGQMVQLDSQFAALCVEMSGQDNELQSCAIALIPEMDRDCAKLSHAIADASEDGALQFTASELQGWKTVSARVSKEATVQAIRRIGNNRGRAEEAAWLHRQRDMLRFVDKLYDGVE